MKKLNINTDVKIYLSLLIYVIAILFVISPNSYIYDITVYGDAATFFMCGKAWMNGMIPYVDFADSKGPLLWLINGIGYLISNYNYIGVFWLLCISFSLTLFTCYKIGCLLTGSKRMGYAVALLMALPYFDSNFFWETKSEAWCHPLIAISLYYLLKEILHPTHKSARITGIVFGMSLMGAVLIKWSVGVMMLSFFISVLILQIKRHQSFISYTLCFLFGAISIFLPFAVYFVATDSFGALIHEYFINTSKTVGENGIFHFATSYFHDIIQFAKFKPHLMVVLYISSAYLFYRQHREITILPFVCGVFFLAITIKHNIWHYYTLAVLTFAIFFMIILVEKFASNETLTNKRIMLIYCIGIFLNIYMYFPQQKGALFFNKENRKGFYDAAYLMSQIHNPTILYNSIDIGIGMPVNSLPATKHWIRQAGATNEMLQSREEAIKQHKPDFIINTGNRWDLISYDKLGKSAIAAGYKYYLAIMPGWELYGPKGLRMPPKDFKVSDMDVLMKRKINFPSSISQK